MRGGSSVAITVMAADSGQAGEEWRALNELADVVSTYAVAREEWAFKHEGVEERRLQEIYEVVLVKLGIVLRHDVRSRAAVEKARGKVTP